jgi:hypothetical protein
LIVHFQRLSNIDTIHSFLLQQQSNGEDHKYAGKSADNSAANSNITVKQI